MDSSRTTAARGASRLARCRERSFLRLYLCIRSLLYACVWAVGCARPAGSRAHDGEGRVTSLESYIWCTSSSTIASISLTATHNRDRRARNAPRARPSLTARSDVRAGRGLSTQSKGRRVQLYALSISLAAPPRDYPRPQAVAEGGGSGRNAEDVVYVTVSFPGAFPLAFLKRVACLLSSICGALSRKLNVEREGGRCPRISGLESQRVVPVRDESPRTIFSLRR